MRLGGSYDDKELTDMSFHRSCTEFNDSQALVKLNNDMEGMPLGEGVFWLALLTDEGVTVDESRMFVFSPLLMMV
jgi:hypothetical protein